MEKYARNEGSLNRIQQMRSAYGQGQSRSGTVGLRKKVPIGERSTSGGRGLSPGTTQGRPERPGIDFYGASQEQENYERKRQENLRQQIAVKERQLAEMARASEGIKQRMARQPLNQDLGADSRGSSNRYINHRVAPYRNASKSPSQGGGIRSQTHYDQQPVQDRPYPGRADPQRQGASPLRKTSGSVDRSRDRSPVELPVSDSNFGGTREYRMTSPDQRLTSALRTKSKSRSPPRFDDPGQFDMPERDGGLSIIRPQPVPAGPTNATRYESLISQKDQYDARQRDRIETLQIDNASLERRLKLVEQELDRVKEEKSRINGRLHQQLEDNTQLERALASGDSIDHTNQSIQDDLQRRKNDNKRVQQDIQDAQFQIKANDDTILRLQVDQKNLKLQKNDLEHDFDDRMLKLDSMDRERLETTKTIIDVQSRIDMAAQEEHAINKINSDLESHIRGLQTERINLLKDLEKLTVSNDEFVREVGVQRRNVDHQNDWQTKLIVAKMLAHCLGACAHNRKEEALNEMRMYSKFDLLCQKKLQAFSLVLLKLGQYNKGIALRRWYDNALKPIDTHYQNYDLAAKVSNDKIKQAVFAAWKKDVKGRMDTYEQKTNAINKVWEKLCQSANADVKRAVNIWKEKNRFDNKRVAGFRKILMKRLHSALSQALLRWKGYSIEIDQACRMIMLKQEYSQKFYLTTLFNAFKYEVRVEKHHRILMQGKVFKALQDYIVYQRHLMQINLTSLHLQKARKKALLKACVDALRNYKERKKHGIMDCALNQDMIPALNETSTFNKKKSQAIQARSVKNRTDTVKTMFGRRLYQYFAHWKTHTQQMGGYANSKLKDRIFGMYRAYLSTYFLHWKKQDVKRTVRKKKKMMMSMEMESKGMENEAILGAQKEKKQAEAVRSSQQKHGTKQLKKLMARVYRNAFDRWKDHQREREDVKGKQNSVLNKFKRRLQRQALEKWKEVAAWQKQNARNIASAQYLQETVNKRIMRKKFESYVSYINAHKKATAKLGYVDQRIDRWWLRKSFRDFNAKLHLKKNQELHTQKQKGIALNEEMNELIGQQEKAHRENEKVNENILSNMKRKAQKLMGNYFARYYANNTERRFKQWKEWSNLQSQKQRILKRSIDHWRKKSFELVAHALKAFGEEQKKREKTHKIKRQVIMQEEQEQSIVNNNETAVLKRDRAQAEQVRSVRKQNKAKARIHKSISIMTDKNHNLEWVSRKRQIFTAWRFCVKQQVAFLVCVKDVLQKSMWAQGFEAIQQASRDTKDERRRGNLMKKFIYMMQQSKYGESMTRWKYATWGVVDDRINTTTEAYNQTVVAFNSKIKSVKAQNMKNGAHHFHKKHLKKIFNAWRDQSEKFKLNRVKTGEGHEQFAAVQHKRYLQKWMMRVELTKKLRQNLAKCEQNKAFRLKRMVWCGLTGRRYITTWLTKSLSNLERLFRERAFAVSFKSIQAYARSKKLTIAKNRVKSSRDLGSMLTKYYFERLRRYFGRWRASNKDKNFRAQHVRKIFHKIADFNLRNAFTRWHRITDQIVFAEEMNQTGPITEHVFEANRLAHNLKEFMRSENYTPEEITNTDNKVKEYNQYLMEKALKRFRITKEDKKAVGALEHWKKWIATKNLFNYYVKEGNNVTQFGKCDLNWAFKKWLNADHQMHEYLGRQNLVELKNMNIIQAKMLDRLANREAEDCAILNHLNLQRDELIEAYIKAQRHALSLFRDNHRHTREKAFNRWKNWIKNEKQRDAKGRIQAAVEEITNIKGRISTLETTNSVLAKENDELRQFSMDGFQIAKNVQQLSNEREDLSVDLADKTNQIRQLLEDNRRLKLKLLNLGIDDDDPVGQGPRLDDQPQIRTKNSTQFPHGGHSASIRGKNY